MDLVLNPQKTESGTDTKSKTLPVLEELFEEEFLFKKILETHPELDLHASLNSSKHHSRKFVNIMVCGD